jgi:hypothetical protein
MDRIEEIAKVIWNTPQDHVVGNPGSSYALKMRLSWDEAQRAARAQESNLAWLLREMDDLRGALGRLEKACEAENGLASPGTEIAPMVEERFGRKSMSGSQP